MAIDHLVFNLLKWFNINNDSTEISANNKALRHFTRRVVIA